MIDLLCVMQAEMMWWSNYHQHIYCYCSFCDDLLMCPFHLLTVHCDLGFFKESNHLMKGCVAGFIFQRICAICLLVINI